MKARFEHIEDYLEQAEALPQDKFVALREKAALALQHVGFPAAKTEAWKYTTVKKLLQQVYSPAKNKTINATKLAGFIMPNTQCIVFVNGRYYAEGSAFDSSAITLKPIMQAPEKLGDLTVMDKPGFTALNNALFQQGYYLQIHATVEKPLHILQFAIDLDADEMIQQHNLVEVLPGASVELVEHFIGFDETPAYWRNSVSEYYLSETAQLNYYRVVQEATEAFHTNAMVVEQLSKSNFKAFTADFSGKLLRNDLEVRLQKKDARCVLNGIYLVRGQQQVDNHTNIEHRHATTYSDEYYKGIVDDHAHAVFNGRVFVAEDAQKVDSAQKNSNLLLSKTAEIDTKPELEIYADDVKCAHGATVGQLSEASVFYLQSRGIDIDLAKKILTYGFAYEVVEKIEHELIRDFISKQLAIWFADDVGLKELIQ
jgi:Fe-S cluster assembly protein SufD